MKEGAFGDEVMLAGSTWQTNWSIVGPRLPSSEEYLFHKIALVPLREDQRDRFNSFRAPTSNVMIPNKFYVKHIPPVDHVSGSHRLQIDVEALDEDSAVSAAFEIANRLVASLTMVVGERYHAEYKQIRQKGGSGEKSAWSQILTGYVFEAPAELTKADLRKAAQFYTLLETNSTAANAYDHLMTAWQLQTTGGLKPLRRSILQHYVLCVEAVVNAVMVELRKRHADTIRLNERRFAEDFVTSLSLRADKPKAIREASTRLRELSHQNMIPAIEASATELGISGDIRDAAIGLYRLRSRNLSHPGVGSAADYSKWLDTIDPSKQPCLADRTARSFLSHWCYSKLCT